MFDYKNTSIPFKVGQSSLYGADCLGLIILYLKSQGYKCEWESKIKRGFATYEYFKEKLEENNAILDPSGNIFLHRFVGSAHIGLIIDKHYVYQSNITLKTEYSDIPKNGYRYKYLGDV